MKLLLNYQTVMGARTVVVEVGDHATAAAIMAAHQSLLASSQKFEVPMEEVPTACLVEEMPRYSLKEHMARHRVRVAKLRRVVHRWKTRNVAKILRIKPRLRTVR